MDRIELCRIFVRVVDCGGFTRAADQLNLPRSTVSEAVRTLAGRRPCSTAIPAIQRAKAAWRWASVTGGSVVMAGAGL